MPLIRVGAAGAEFLEAEQYKSETELENVLADHVDLLREGDDPNLAMVTRQLTLPGSGIADLVLVDAAGVPIVVEVKLGRNPQSRREVIAQVFDYASALTDWTVDELDEQTDGMTEAALRSLLDEDESTFRARWRAVGTNLRAGMVRVIVAVDEQTEELSRVVSFINEHSDLDVRLVVVEKYRDPNGDAVFSSTTPILSDDQIASARSGSSARRLAAREGFQAVLDAYDALEYRPLELSGRARNYRPLRHPDWPKAVHYEFLDARGNTNPEIHLESDKVAVIAPVLKTLSNELQAQFPNATCEFSPKWSRGRGRLRIIHDQEATADLIAENMVRLIEATRDRIGEALLAL